MTPGIHKQEPVLLIDGNTVRGVQSGVVPRNSAKRLLFGRSVLAIDHNFGREFDRHEELLLHFIGGDVVDPMRGVEDHFGADISVGFARKTDHLVACVRFH